MFKNYVIKLVKSIIKYHTVVTIITIIFTIITALIALQRFKIKTSLTALLPEHSESVRVLQEVKKTKGSTDNMIIVLEDNNTENLKKFARIIHDKLVGDPLILTVEYHRNIKFIKDRILFHVPLKDLEEMEVKLRERISKTKFDKITDIGLDDEDINPEKTDSEGDVLDTEGDPFKKDMKKRKIDKDVKVTYNEDKKGAEVEKTLENCDPDSDENCEEDEIAFDTEGDPFKTKLNDSRKQKNDKYKRNKEDNDFLAYLNDKLNTYKTSPYANEFKEWRLSPDGRVLVIMLVPSKPAGDVAYAKNLKSHLQKIIKNLKQKYPQYKDIKINYSGSYVTTVEETSEVKKDVVSSIGLSIFLILLVLFLYFGKVKSVLTILTPLLIGMVWTSGIFFIFDSYLNLIAAFIFAILLGLGIDFGIHILDRYLHERKDEKTVEEALLISMTETGKSIVIGGLTTAAAFFSLIFADFKGFSQFGRLASLGILLNIVSIYVIFPVLVIFFENRPKGFGTRRNWYKIIFGKLFKTINQNVFIKTKLIIIILTLALTGVAVLRLIEKPVKFEYDFRKLNKKSKTKKKLVKRYSSATKLSLSPAVILTKSAQETKDIHDVLAKLTKNQEDLVRQPAIFPIIKEYNVVKTYNMTKSIDTFGSIYSFYPNHQKEKQKVLQSINKMLTPSRIKHLSKDEQKSVREIKPYLLSAVPFKLDDLPQFIKNIFKDKKGNYDKMLFLYVKLNKKSKTKKKLVKRYSSATKLSLSPAVILTKSAQETKDIHDVLAKLTKNQEDLVRQPAIFPIIKEYNVVKTYNMTKSIDTFGSIYSFYPNHQKEKQKVLQSINKMLTPSRIKHLSEDEQKSVKEIKPYLLSAVPFKLDDLPQFIKNIFKDKKGNYDKMLFLYVKLNTTNGKNAIKFANEIRSIRVNGKKLKVTAQSLIFADILILIVKDSYKVTVISFIFILLILLIFNRSIKKTLVMVVPLVLGMLATLFFMSYFNIKLSFFNMMIIPTLIGMGIDNSVHLMHRYEAIGENNIYFAYKNIIGSITLSTATTMIGFAGLLTANHQGLNSIGELAIIGMSSMWFMIFLPMPAFLQLLNRNKENK